MPHELNPMYSWATRDVLGSPSTLTEYYLRELKESGVICGGGEEERNYRVELSRCRERICELNLEHPRVPHWLWVNEVMFPEFGVRIPFSSFQQRLLQHCLVAPSQFHPNAWSLIRCFELVTEYLELPQDSEVFLYLFTVFSPYAEGKSKKGYMSVRPGKYRRIFGLYEESFHDFKGRRLNEEQRDTTDIFLWLFSKRHLKPKAVLGDPECAREAILEMAGKNKTLALLRQVMQANPQGLPVPEPSSGLASSSAQEGGGSSNVGEGTGARLEVSSPIRVEGPEQQVEIIPDSPFRKRGNDETTSAQKRPRVSNGSLRDLCLIDRCFDASGFIESNFLGPRALEALRDYDPMESTRWIQWAMLRSATILKSVEPRLTMADQWKRRCTQLTGEMKLLDQRRADVEKEKVATEVAKSKAEKNLEVALEASRGKDAELQRLGGREATLLADIEALKKNLLEEKARADKAESSLVESEKGRQEIIKLVEVSVKATEDALKEKILVVAPDFNVSLLGAFKEVVDGQIVDPPPGS
ncbi:hypothetical protein PIB30_008194 [Stylosanthes scabra]|uniref:Transposase (putative) gypsy type domain-containing protein n=1 Tax=Stylosanthes scabra TaxID=79078 RepID=A0ABU6Z6T0_9FABA|nr:hypothetical protein [Stylosanthes scabra]